MDSGAQGGRRGSLRNGNRNINTFAYRVALLGSFHVWHGSRLIHFRPREQEVIALLALSDQPNRMRVATTIWPDASEKRAHHSLRTSLWRICDSAPALITANRDLVGLGPMTSVDLFEAIASARRLTGDEDCSLADLDHRRLGADLLPDWYDDWILFERERFRQLRIHGLEALSRRHLASGRHDLAIDSALEAIRADSLRESAYRRLIEAHLAEGNVAEALRQYEAYSQRARHELQIVPSEGMKALIRGYGGPIHALAKSEPP